MNLYQHPFHDGMVIRVFDVFPITLFQNLCFGSGPSYTTIVHSLMTIQELKDSFKEETSLYPTMMTFKGNRLNSSDTIKDSHIQSGDRIQFLRASCTCGAAVYSNKSYLFFERIPEHPDCPYRHSE